MAENRGVPSFIDDVVVYLNNATQARFSGAVKDAGFACIQRPAWEQTADPTLIRQLFGRLIHADSQDIAIMPSTAFAITLAAYNIEKQLKQKMGKILILEDQFNSAVFPWQELVDRSEGRLMLDIVPYPENTDRLQEPKETWTTKVLERLKEKDCLVACVPPLHWSDGSLLDLTEISQSCRKQGTWLIVDATQAVGILPVDITTIRPAMLACSIHKWLRGPSGTCLVYIDRELHSAWQPLDQHARGRNVPSTWETTQHEMGPSGYTEKFFGDARKFDSGGKANPILLPMLQASLEQVVELDLDQAQSYLENLMKPIIDWALANDFELSSGPHAFHIVGLRHKYWTTSRMIEIAQELQEEGIYISVRCGGFRISPYIDNTPEDIKRLIDALSLKLAATAR